MVPGTLAARTTRTVLGMDHLFRYAEDAMTYYACAFCGEDNDTFVDPGGGARQVYTEDCAVCCRPNLITVTVDPDGDLQLDVTQEYEA